MLCPCFKERGWGKWVRDAHSPSRAPDSTFLKASTQEDQESGVLLSSVVSVWQASAMSDLI